MSQPVPSNTFLNEAEDLLGQIEEIILEVRPGDAPGEPINHLFRAFHTIMGSGAMFGFDTVAAFRHHVETVLDKVREGVVPLSQELIDLILASKDQIKALLDEAQGGSGVPPEKGQHIITALNGLLPGGNDASLPVKTGPIAAVPIPQVGAATGSCRHTFRISFRPVPGLMASGTDPLLLLNELRALGDCRIVADPTAIPPLGQLQPDQCYLAWEVTLVTERGIDAIKDVFIFVDDGSCVAIEPVVSANLPAGPETATAVSSSPAAREGAGPQRPVPCHDAARKPTAKAKDSSTRVPSERLDRLVTLVGEMVMNQSRLTQVAAGAGLPLFTAPVEVLERLVAELRDNVLGICMMPIGTTFSPYKRLIHDLSAELGKEIDLVTEGAETELDKTVLDQLGDPLVHLIRNSIDHGIEPAQARKQASKPPRGSIRLAAAHIGSSVVITIQDDGRGLEPDIIRAKAVERKLIAPDSAISKDELFNLIFLPGFSTAHAVTSVSGRGVGKAFKASPIP